MIVALFIAGTVLYGVGAIFMYEGMSRLFPDYDKDPASVSAVFWPFVCFAILVYMVFKPVVVWIHGMSRKFFDWRAARNKNKAKPNVG